MQPPRAALHRRQRLESRLLASHLLLAALPTILLTLLGAGAIRFLIQRTQAPEVEESLTRSAALAHAVQHRMSGVARRLLASLPVDAPDELTAAAVRARLADAGFDFAVWEATADRPGVVVEEEAGDGAALDSTDWSRLHEGRTPPVAGSGTFRFFDEAGRDGAGRCVGHRPEADVYEAVTRAAEDYTRYRQLFRVERVYESAFAFALAAVLALTAIVAFVVARTTARRISRPVTALSEAADRLAAGDLAHRAPPGRADEIGDLVTAFNRMGAQLERSRDELVRAERVAAWRDVARRVAHEIRNPLTPISLAVHRLERRLGEDPAARDCLTSIGEEIENLRRISETFSEFARMPEPRLARIDLAHVASSVAELYRDTVPGVELHLSAPQSLPVVGDRDLLRRAISNLVKNAGEALSGTGGTIRVTVQQSENVAMVEVADDGPGVPEEIRSTLFRPGVSGRPGGSGLGLAMVQRIASDHRGALDWRDAQPGSVFTLRIPVDLEEE